MNKEVGVISATVNVRRIRSNEMFSRLLPQPFWQRVPLHSASSSEELMSPRSLTFMTSKVYRDGTCNPVLRGPEPCLFPLLWSWNESNDSGHNAELSLTGSTPPALYKGRRGAHQCSVRASTSMSSRVHVNHQDSSTTSMIPWLPAYHCLHQRNGMLQQP